MDFVSPLVLGGSSAGSNLSYNLFTLSEWGNREILFTWMIGLETFSEKEKNPIF